MSDATRPGCFRATLRIVVATPPRKVERPYPDARIGFLHSFVRDAHGLSARTIVFVPEELRVLADREP